MNFKQAWKQEEIETLVAMWHQGETAADIAKKLNRKRSSILQYAHRNREKLGLGHRQVVAKARPKNLSFEQQWYGSVPFGHWTITKAWGKK